MPTHHSTVVHLQMHCIYQSRCYSSARCCRCCCATAWRCYYSPGSRRYAAAAPVVCVATAGSCQCSAAGMARWHACSKPPGSNRCRATTASSRAVSNQGPDNCLVSCSNKDTSSLQAWQRQRHSRAQGGCRVTHAPSRAVVNEDPNSFLVLGPPAKAPAPYMAGKGQSA
jgi:hypothetical protein